MVGALSVLDRDVGFDAPGELLEGCSGGTTGLEYAAPSLGDAPVIGEVVLDLGACPGLVGPAVAWCRNRLDQQRDREAKNAAR